MNSDYYYVISDKDWALRSPILGYGRLRNRRYRLAGFSWKIRIGNKAGWLISHEIFKEIKRLMLTETVTVSRMLQMATEDSTIF